LGGAGGRRLAAAARAGRLRREVPFLVRLDGGGGPACYLSGAVDALLEEGGELEVVDYKYALPRPGMAERHRWQLAAYALAAVRARPGRRVRASLQFLRGRCDAVDVTPSAADLDRLAAEAPRLAAEMHRGAALPTPAALGRTRGRCEAEGCGYAYRCYPEPRPGRSRGRDP
ncbi:MAG TPA: PD-(D/E)XK nuclease family protein, partial [Anaeromyxobacteraceae bacterium]